MSLSKRSMGILCLVLAAAPAAVRAEALGPQVLEVEPFVELPAGVRYPEGLAANPGNGEIYVGTFDAREPASVRNNQLLRYAADGRLLAQRAFAATPLTGVGYADGQIYILNFGAGKLQRIAADFTADSPVEDLLDFPRLSPAVPAPRSVANPDGSQDRIHFGADYDSSRSPVQKRWPVFSMKTSSSVGFPKRMARMRSGKVSISRAIHSWPSGISRRTAPSTIDAAAENRVRMASHNPGGSSVSMVIESPPTEARSASGESSATSLPSFRMAMRSARSASSSKCVVRTIVTPISCLSVRR